MLFEINKPVLVTFLKPRNQIYGRTNGGKRKGVITAVYEKFVCVRIFADRNSPQSWVESFLFVDLSIGVIAIEPRKSNKKGEIPYVGNRTSRRTNNQSSVSGSSEGNDLLAAICQP